MRDLDIWRDQTRVDELTVQMVDPHTLSVVRGELGSVMDCTITEGYFTDGRVSGQVTALDDDTYVADSMLRIVHRIPDIGYSAELLTGYVTQLQRDHSDNSTTTTYSLDSTLWALSEDTLPRHFSIGAGATTDQAFESVLRKTCGREYLLLPGAKNSRFSQTVVYELGDSFLSDLFDICDRSGNRLDVDGHGRITIAAYVPPSAREPDWVIDANESRSIVLDEGDGWTDKPGEAYNRVIVVHKNGDNETVGYVDAGAGYRYANGNVGWLRAKVISENDLSPDTSARATELARQRLAENVTVETERKVKCMYFPVHEGEVIRFSLDGDTRKCLVKQVDADLSDWTVSLTLKEV